MQCAMQEIMVFVSCMLGDVNLAYPESIVTLYVGAICARGEMNERGFVV